MKRIKKLISAVLVLTLVLSVAQVVPAAAEGTLALGDTGEEVKKLQTRLSELSYDETETDGVFGPGTEKAVAAFQRRNRLLETGMADPTTQRVLYSDSAVPAKKSSARAATEANGLSADVLFDVEYATEEDGMAFYEAPASTFMPVMKAATGARFTELARDGYSYIKENGFVSAASSPLSTFAADVDTSSYAQLRRMILEGRAVPRDAVRIEEMLNYFHYTAGAPKENEPFHVQLELTECPWNADTRLLRVCLTAREASAQEKRPRHLIFLIDTSGSMTGSDRLDLVKRAFLMLLDTLDGRDHISIVTYASEEKTVLEYVPASEKTRIMEAITSLEAGGWTNGGAGILSAYALADAHRQEGESARILLATDGDLNVGITSEGELARLVMDKKRSGTLLTVLGFGYGNYQDNKLEALADYGDGVCHYIDTIYEARRALISEAGGAFDLVAKDVKLQLDFNPAYISGYRLIGYEDRVMEARDFDDDQKDGGEVGSGQQVTALYELAMAGSGFAVDTKESRYQSAGKGQENGQLLTLDIRAKTPGSDVSQLFSYPMEAVEPAGMSGDQAFAAAVAMTGMLLRDSEYKGSASWAKALELMRDKAPITGDPYREEFLYLVTLLERQSK